MNDKVTLTVEDFRRRVGVRGEEGMATELCLYVQMVSFSSQQATCTSYVNRLRV